MDETQIRFMQIATAMTTQGHQRVLGLFGLDVNGAVWEFRVTMPGAPGKWFQLPMEKGE